MARFVLTFILVLWNLSLVWTDTAQEFVAPTRRNVTRYLLDPGRYDPTNPPNIDNDIPTNVSVQISLHNVYSLREIDMEYSVEMYLQTVWLDERLNFSNLTLYERLVVDINSQDNVWKPDVFFLNEKRANVHSVVSPNKLMHIYRNGTVVYSIRLSLTLSCTMDLHHYPFDNQTCFMIIQSFGYTVDLLRLKWFPQEPFVIENVEMPQFSLQGEKTELSNCMSTYHTMGTFSTLKVRLFLKRRLGSFFVQLFLPSILFSMLSWVSFWVDAGAVPARVSIGVTCVLSTVAQFSSVRQSTPYVSHVKAVDVWVFVCILYVFAALLEFAVVNMLLRRGSRQMNIDNSVENAHATTEIDTPVDTGNSLQIAQIEVAMESENVKHIHKTRFGCIPVTSCMPGINCRYGSEDLQARARTVDRVSRVLFPGTYLIFLLVFFLVLN